jgi:excisionase family DNA binding protein
MMETRAILSPGFTHANPERGEMMDEITAARAANLTGVSERTIRRKIAAGVLPARRLRQNRFAIRVADLQVLHPWETLAARIEVLEQRLDRLEAGLRVLAGVQEAGQPELGAALNPAGPVVSAEVQQLFALLAYETARLSRSLSLSNLAMPGPSEAVTTPTADPAPALSDTPARSQDLLQDLRSDEAV